MEETNVHGRIQGCGGRIRAAALGGALAVVGFAPRGWADPVQTLPCRPTIACTADLVPAGSFELETGGFLRLAPGAAPTWALPFLAKLSLTDWFQLQLGSAGPTWSGGLFAMDVGTVIAKFRLWRQGAWAPSVALSVGAAFGLTPASQSYQPVEGVQAALYLSRDIGRFHLDLNVGYNALAQGGGELTHSLWTSVSTGIAWTPALGSFHELYHFTPTVTDGPPEGGFLFGLTLSPSPGVMFDVGADVALFRDSRTVNAFIGLTFATQPLWGSVPRSRASRQGRPGAG